MLANDDYKTQIATRAAADDLPDVFLLQGMNTISWANQGLMYDLTDSIKNSPYADQYKMDYMIPFTANDKYWAYPALTGGTCTVVIYDSAMWKEAGFDTFPTTWADVEKAAEYFSGQGIDTIAFGNSGQWQLNSCFVSCLGYQYTGTQWFADIIKKWVVAAYLAVPVALYVFTVFAPLVAALFYSFFEWKGGPVKTFSGFANYAQLFSDEVFWSSFWHNIFLVIVCIVGQIGLAFIVVLLINSNLNP